MTYFESNFSTNVGRKTNYPSYFFAVLQFDVRVDFDDGVPVLQVDTLPFLVASPLHTLADTRAVSSMEVLIAKGTFDI
jgi:hypothetical protein